jgi:hypothetical protein
MQRVVVFLCVIVCLYAGSAIASDSIAPVEREAAEGRLPIGGGPELFRLEMIDFLKEAEASLVRASALPPFGEFLGAHMSGGRVPAFDEAILQINMMSADELSQAMDALGRSPKAFGAPRILDEAVAILEKETQRAACGDVLSERAKIETLTRVQNGLGLAVDSISIAKSVIFMILDIVNAGVTTCESPIDIPTSSVQIPVVIADGVLDITIGVIRLAAAEVGFAIVPAKGCIDSCVGHGFADYHQPDNSSNALTGKGCDNRDNNCGGGIDEPGEDMVAPVLLVDENLTNRCYRSAAEAQAVVDLAIKADDDCSAVTPNVSLTTVTAACRGTVIADVTDDANNRSSIDPLILTIDADPPLLTPAPLAACYPNLASARAAFSQTTIQDCTAVTSEIETVENACVAELELNATDECGNRSLLRENVRLDGTEPVVGIDAIFLPRVDGLACFESVQRAVDTVVEATRASDNCSPLAGLTMETTSSGAECDLVVRSVAMDECGLIGADEIQVRVDKAPPVVTCSVDVDNLWPADDTMRDVGFSYTVNDNCNGSAMDVRVDVTSDEATAYGLKVKSTQNEVDPSPDATLVRLSDGTVTDVLLRAQRRPDKSADGRVYRIRVTATDSCGLESFADCFVTVPTNFSTGPGVGAVFNSGQEFDATSVN